MVIALVLRHSIETTPSIASGRGLLDFFVLFCFLLVWWWCDKENETASAAKRRKKEDEEDRKSRHTTRSISNCFKKMTTADALDQAGINTRPSLGQNYHLCDVDLQGFMPYLWLVIICSGKFKSEQQPIRYFLDLCGVRHYHRVLPVESEASVRRGWIYSRIQWPVVFGYSIQKTWRLDLK